MYIYRISTVHRNIIPYRYMYTLNCPHNSTRANALHPARCTHFKALQRTAAHCHALQRTASSNNAL